MSEPNEVVVKTSWKGADDRRRSPRLECTGNAHLRMLDLESAGTVQFHGKILNLSLLGCCIEIESVIPFRVKDRLEVYFQLNGMPVLIMGIIRAIHTKHKIGIEFLDVSTRKQEQLRYIMNDLLEQLTEKVMKHKAAAQ
jgi:c-di-GMP-binding flagellar brake protein YcgR